jgi:transposase InsO family protein
MKLPKSGKEYDTILTITDHDCTKAAIFIPCHETITAEGVATLYQRHIYPKFSFPKKFISDRDTRFTSKFAKGLNAALGIQLNMSTAYHPQTDGQSERTNQGLKTFIRCYCDEEQDNWHIWLPMAEFAHNQWPNATTKKAPFDLIMGYVPQIKQIKKPSPVPQLEEQLAELERIRKVAWDAMLKAQAML